MSYGVHLVLLFREKVCVYAYLCGICHFDKTACALFVEKLSECPTFLIVVMHHSMEYAVLLVVYLRIYWWLGVASRDVASYMISILRISSNTQGKFWLCLYGDGLALDAYCFLTNLLLYFGLYCLFHIRRLQNLVTNTC